MRESGVFTGCGDERGYAVVRSQSCQYLSEVMPW